MQYNSDSDNQDIVSLVGDLTNTDTTQYSLKAITRAANKWMKKVWFWIFTAYGGWLYDDSNNTSDFPIATTALVANQQDYGLPSTALVVRGVDVKTTGGVWQKLSPLTEEQIRDYQSDAEFMKTPSQPNGYLPYGGSVRLFPPTNYSQAASLRVSFARGSILFASTDTTKTPGFLSEFHEVIAVGAAYEFVKRRDIKSAAGLREDLLGEDGYKNSIKTYYSSRYAEMFPPRITTKDGVREFR